MSRFRLAAVVSIVACVAASPGPSAAQERRASSRPAAATATATPTASAAAPAPASQCIMPAATQAVEGCPSNAPRNARGLAKAEVPRSRFKAVDRKDEVAKKSGPTGPSIELDAATRRNRENVQARAFNMLQQEVRLLNRLVRNTRANNPQRPDILLRLAETYFEMQQALNNQVRSLDEPMHQARQKKNGAKVRQLRGQQQRIERNLDSVRQEAIRTYATLVQDHPNYRRMDEVMFSLAFGLEELKQHDRARQVYHRLIKGFPQSRFVPHAYLSFAEFYFNEGDMNAAMQFYDKVLEFPPERNPIYGYSLYKQAWAAYNLEDFRAALEKFVRVLEFAQANPDARDVENLSRQSRKELILPYANVGSPERALEFFSRYAKDRPQAMEMLESLAELYYDTGKWPKTISSYQKLIAENASSPRICYWQSRIANAVVSSSPKPDQVREIQRLVDLYTTFAGGQVPAEALAECKQSTAGLLVWLATAWHREAIGTDDQPGTNDRKTMEQASQLYRMVIDKFPDMEQMQFPDLDRRDWPTQYKVAYYYAELLWKMEDWAQCGPAFDRVVELNPQGEFTTDAAYAAVLCYNNLYQQQYQANEREVASGEQQEPEAQQPARGRRGRRGRRGQQQAEQPESAKFAPREFTSLEQGMLNAFQRYVCFVPDSEELPTIKYRRARIYYEANRFEEAALLFKDVAYNHRESDLAIYAANLYLDSLNVLGTKMEAPRSQCILALKESIDPLWGFYCNTQEAYDGHQELCQTLEQLRCDVLRKEAEAYQGEQQFKKAAATYVRIFRRFQECGELDEVLYNAAINFEAARLLGSAIKVRQVLIERFPESQWSKRAIYLLGANWHAIAVYDRAADYYEQFAEKFPSETGEECTDEEKTAKTCAVAHEALMNAVFFRLGLGQDDKAIEDARLFERNYRRSKPRETSQVIFSLGSIFKRTQDWPKVIDHYQDYLRSYGRTSIPHQEIVANLEIGKAYWARNDKRRADGFFKKAVQIWQRGAAAEINSLESDEAEKARFLVEGLNGAAESLFYLAEYKYQDFKDIEFPRYRGGRSMDRVKKWAEKEFVDWMAKKMKALQAAEAEYNKIAEVKVEIGGQSIESPPWLIAAAARIGEMYRSFVDEFRDAPIPDEIVNDTELRDVYEGELDEQSEPLVRQAIGKFEFCIRTSTNVRWFNEYSRQCEQELNVLNPREYPVAAELRGRADYVRNTPARPRAAELGRGDDEGLEEGGADAAAAGGES